MSNQGYRNEFYRDDVTVHTGLRVRVGGESEGEGEGG